MTENNLIPGSGGASGKTLTNPVRFMNAVVMFLYRTSGGRVANRMQKAPIMLLTSTGWRSGKPRTNPVLYIQDGEDYVAVASAGGAKKDPSWFVNLMHNPDALITVGRMRTRVKARRASPDERARLWPRMTSVYSTYDDYAKKTPRQIPVVILTPVP